MCVCVTVCVYVWQSHVYIFLRLMKHWSWGGGLTIAPNSAIDSPSDRGLFQSQFLCPNRRGSIFQVFRLYIRIYLGSIYILGLLYIDAWCSVRVFIFDTIEINKVLGLEKKKITIYWTRENIYILSIYKISSCWTCFIREQLNSGTSRDIAFIATNSNKYINIYTTVATNWIWD